MGDGESVEQLSVMVWGRISLHLPASGSSLVCQTIISVQGVLSWLGKGGRRWPLVIGVGQSVLQARPDWV